MAFLIRPVRILAAACVALSLCANAWAQDSLRLVEADIKAGLIYNFLRYTQWPPSARADEPVTVCTYGGDPFSGRLASMAGRTVNQRPIELREVRASPEIERCSLLVVNAERRADWPRLRTYLDERPILTVSDYDGFARSGGMIEFARSNSRISVRLNVGAAEASSLQVQDRLLRLASIVRTEPR